MGNKQKHLECLQGAINRTAGNLFLLKGWTITLIAACSRCPPRTQTDHTF